MKKRQGFAGLQRLWKKQSIQNQIFLSMFLITILGVGFLINVVYQASINAVEANYRTSYESTLKNSSRVIDLNLRSIIEAGRSFLNDASLRQILEKGDEYGGHLFSTEDQEVLKDLANELASQQVWVNYVIFADLYGHYYQKSNINKGTYDFYNYYENHDMTGESWAEKAREARGKEVFFGENVFESVIDSGFSFAKYMINPSTGKPMGYMVISFSRKLLGRSFVMSGEGYPSSRFMVVDEQEKQIVYQEGDKDTAEQLKRMYFYPEENKEYLFSSVKNSTTGWSVVNAVEKNELSAESQKIRTTAVWMTGAVLLAGFFLARIISKTITRPLKQLEDMISRVGEGERHITDEFDMSEVGRIGRQFKEMVNTNLELSEHLMAVRLNEQEAELLLLQSQINPHYLYNTLDSLYFVAMMHGDEQMAELIEALSNNFKLSLNNGSKYISVADSIKWIQEYMKLQNLRFNNRFELFVDVQREILPCRTITFILQPFIENAMYHGLEPKIGKGRISLTGWQEQNRLIFTIEDDGVGIDDMSRLEKGYGIRNVKERIRLNYGENYGVTVQSTPGEGTKVTVVVPAE